MAIAISIWYASRQFLGGAGAGGGVDKQLDFSVNGNLMWG